MNEPNIRFKGFEGEWKNSLIGDVSSSFSGGTPTADVAEYYGGDIPFIRSGEIHSNKTELFLSEKGLENSSAKIVNKGTVLYALYGATSGEVGISQLKGAINQAILAIYPNKNIEKRFLAHFLQSHKDKIVGELLQGGQGNLSGELVKNISVFYPQIDEQIVIADYIDSINSQISAANSRLSSLKQVKEASLQAMFPQEGETVPKIRFKGFEGEWKHVKLKDISVKVVERNKSNSITTTLTNSAEYGIIDQRDFFDHDISNVNNISGYFVVQPQDFVYNPRISTLAPVGPINMNKLGYSGVMSPLYYVFGVYGINKDYLDVFFRTNVWHKFMKDNGNTGARFDRLSISDEVFCEMPICCPKDENEQQKIASYFTALDKQITLQSQRLEKLKQIKAACLDKMFV